MNDIIDTFKIDEELSRDEFKDMDPKSKFLYSTGMGYVIGQLEKLGIDEITYHLPINLLIFNCVTVSILYVKLIHENMNNIIPPKSKSWNTESVRNMLRNRIYIGQHRLEMKLLNFVQNFRYITI